MLGLPLSRLEVEIVGALILVAAVLLWLGFHDAKVANEATAPVIASIQAAEAAASAAEAIHAAKVESEQKDNLHEAQAQNQARVDVSRALALDVQRMHDDAVRSGSAARSARPAAGGASGSESGAGMVPADLFASALEARASAESDAAALAGFADSLRTSGQLCARDYDALR